MGSLHQSGGLLSALRQEAGGDRYRCWGLKYQHSGIAFRRFLKWWPSPGKVSQNNKLQSFFKLLDNCIFGEISEYIKMVQKSIFVFICKMKLFHFGLIIIERLFTCVTAPWDVRNSSRTRNMVLQYCLSVTPGLPSLPSIKDRSKAYLISYDEHN